MKHLLWVVAFSCLTLCQGLAADSSVEPASGGWYSVAPRPLPCPEPQGWCIPSSAIPENLSNAGPPATDVYNITTAAYMSPQLLGTVINSSPHLPE